MTPGPGIEPGTHWWKASALTTTPTLLPLILQSQKRRRHPSKITFDLIRAQAGKAINNKTILCKARVASLIVSNYVNKTNNSSVNFWKFHLCE